MDKVQGIARHVLTFVGGLLVMYGGVDEETWTLVSGAIITAGGGIWSIWDKMNRA